jgi:hypothetical protein
MNRRDQDPYWKNILKGLVKYKYKKKKKGGGGRKGERENTPSFLEHLASFLIGESNSV